jgi:hypothetical protein
MISKEEKEKLLRLKEFNSILSEFSPNSFYSIKNYDTSITTSNVLQTMPNLERSEENEYETSSSPLVVNFENLIFYFKTRRFNKCFELMRFYLENLLRRIDPDTKNFSYIKDKLQKMFFNRVINYSIYYASLKISDILDEYLSNDFIKSNKIETKNEISYHIIHKNIKIQQIREALQSCIKHYINCLISYDHKKFSYLSEEYQGKYFKFLE